MSPPRAGGHKTLFCGLDLGWVGVLWGTKQHKTGFCATKPGFVTEFRSPLDIDGDSDDFDRENLIILRLRGKKYGGYLFSP